MPELPEVETIRRGVLSHTRGRSIEAVLGEDNRLLRHNHGGVAELRKRLTGRKVNGVGRRGKFMWLTFEGQTEVLIIHLGMSGQVHVRGEATNENGVEPENDHPTTSSATASTNLSNEPLAKHEHVRLVFDSGKALSFVDARTFGHLTLSDARPDGSHSLVPTFMNHIARDPLEEPDLSRFFPVFANTRRAVKTVLLDQRSVSGIGNIYADEALFERRIHGSAQARTLTKKEVAGLLQAARDVMLRALEVGGTSFDQYYVDVTGNPGYFSRSLNVYGRAGEECRKCGCVVEKTVISGRSHYFCPKCQPQGPQ